MVADRDESEHNVLTAVFDLHEKGCRILIREDSSLHSAVSKVYGPGSDGSCGKKCAVSRRYQWPSSKQTST
jgi:hypothetical protein